MYIQETKLENVRQFEKVTFDFHPGFNLLVGGNGSGKSTLLQALLVSLGGRAAASAKRAAFSDNDIRLKSDQMSILTLVADEDRLGEYPCRYIKHLRGRATRPGGLPDVPVILYESNEALSKSLRSKSCRKVRFNNPSNQRATFDYLMAGIERGTFLPSDSVESSQERFGDSNEVRDFVLEALRSLSESFLDFGWMFEAYDCTVSGAISEKRKKEGTYYQDELANFLLRSFESNPEIMAKLDRRVVQVGSDGRLRGIAEGLEVSPSFDQIIRVIFGDDDDKIIKESEGWIAEVKLTPQIVVKTRDGEFPISQLSDGEQRLFSLFVNLAREISRYENTSVRDSSMIVLIDEVDVHLHPKWQRKVAPTMERLFPNCQFIATTHSPFVIQSVPLDRVQEVTKEGGMGFDEKVTTIDDIAEEIQGIDMPQRSMRAEALSNAAELYFGLLRDSEASEVELQKAEKKYREASEPFSDNPAVDALLRVEKFQASKER